MASFEHKVSRNLQCPVCLELLSDPKQLSCTHTFCKKCLNDILQISSQNSLTCPICRNKTDVKGGNVLHLKTNVPLKSLIDDVRNSKQFCDMCDTNLKAIHFCCECGKNMCNTCLQHHNTWKPNLKHKVVSVEDIREGRVVLKKKVFCQEHKSDGHEHICTDVCITCKKLICLRCRLLRHENKGHTVHDVEEYNASIKTKIESLQARTKTKTTSIRNNVSCIKTQKKRVTDHIAGRKAEVNRIYKESIKKLNERKAAIDKQLEAQEVELCKRLDEMKDADERWITSIESASVLVGNSLKAPLEGDIIVIRDSLSGELKNVLDKNDPEKKLAIDVTDRAEQLIFIPNHQGDQLNIGIVKFVKCELECDVKHKSRMNGMVATSDGRMAVGYGGGGIDIFSADGQLHETVLKDVKILDVGFLSYGRYVVLNMSNTITLYTQMREKLDATFQTLSFDEGGYSNVTVDSNDLIYVSYRKPEKIQVFSQLGGKAIREIPCDGYESCQIISYNASLIISNTYGLRMVDKKGDVKYTVEQKSGMSVCAAVTQNNSILIAWVKDDDGMVSIDEYTSELKHIHTLISDHKIEKSERQWYYLQEFRSGEIAFCTPDRLYIFKLTVTPVSG